MAKCIRCGQRKARRTCPGLDAELCSLCCGRHRRRDIPCPEGCPHMVQHEPRSDRGVEECEAEEVLNDERLVWLAYHIEHPLGAQAGRSPAFNDEDAVRALEFARDKLLRSSSLIIVPGAIPQAGQQVGETVFQSMERCRYERRIVLAGTDEGYGREEKLRVLDRLLSLLRAQVRERPGGRAYLQQLLDRHRRAEEMSGRPRLISSD